MTKLTIYFKIVRLLIHMESEISQSIINTLNMHSNEKKTLETPAQVLEMKYSLLEIWILSQIYYNDKLSSYPNRCLVL